MPAVWRSPAGDCCQRVVIGTDLKRPGEGERPVIPDGSRSELEDKLRKKAVSPNTIREAFQFISAADRVLSGVRSAGKKVLTDLSQVLDSTPDDKDDAEQIEANPDQASKSVGKGAEEAS